jgi:hypothetical protein
VCPVNGRALLLPVVVTGCFATLPRAEAKSHSDNSRDNGSRLCP